MLTTQSRVGTQVGRQAGKSRTDLKDLNPLSGFGMALLAPHIHIGALCTKASCKPDAGLEGHYTNCILPTARSKSMRRATGCVRRNAIVKYLY
jgi:hypothetical protein